MTVPDFVDAVRTYRALLGGSVTSWGRTIKHNVDVGGVMNSAHQFDLAVDLVYDQPPPAPRAVDVGRRLGLLVIREDDHDHLQPLDWIPG